MGGGTLCTIAIQWWQRSIHEILGSTVPQLLTARWYPEEEHVSALVLPVVHANDRPAVREPLVKLIKLLLWCNVIIVKAQTQYGSSQALETLGEQRFRCIGIRHKVLSVTHEPCPLIGQTCR